MQTEDRCFLGIDIGGTKVAFAVADAGGHILAEDRIATRPQRGPAAVIAEIGDHAAGLIAGRDVVACGIGCVGPLDPARGVVYGPPPNLPGWDNVPLVAPLRERLGLPVVLDNDCNVAALGEWRFGAGRGLDDLVYVTIGTGIGGGVIVGGRLLRGVGNGAGEIGHLTILPDGPRCNCGNRGCLEALASGPAIARRARAALARGEPSSLDAGAGLTAEQVIAAARAGDALARVLWDETVEYLAVGLANVICVLAPPRIILGGGVSEAGDFLLVPLRAALARRVFQVPVEQVEIVPAALGPHAGVLGAVALAQESTLSPA